MAEVKGFDIENLERKNIYKVSDQVFENIQNRHVPDDAAPDPGDACRGAAQRAGADAARNRCASRDEGRQGSEARQGSSAPRPRREPGAARAVQLLLPADAAGR